MREGSWRPFTDERPDRFRSPFRSLEKTFTEEDIYRRHLQKTFTKEDI